MYKSLVSGGLALLAAFALQPAIAQAHTQIGTTIGTTVGEDWSPAQYYPGYPDYDDEDNYGDEDYISCSEGRRIVRQHGFWHVSPIRCSGEV